MASELFPARLRGSQVLKFQQRGQGCTQAEKGPWQHEDEAFMDALELIDRRDSPSQVRGQDPLFTSDVFWERHNEHQRPALGQLAASASPRVLSFHHDPEAANTGVSLLLVPRSGSFLRFHHHKQTKTGARKEVHEKMFPLDN
jgi:hypothetical protein